MHELEVLEAKVPVRTPRLIEVEAEPQIRPDSNRFAPVAGWLNGPGGLGKSWLCQGLEQSALLGDLLGRTLPTLVLLKKPFSVLVI